MEDSPSNILDKKNTSFCSKVYHKLIYFFSKSKNNNITDISNTDGVISESKKYILKGIDNFDNILSKEIMTPRTEVFYLNINSDLKINLDSILNQNYSRIPIFDNDIDNIVGVLFMKDLFSYIVRNKTSNIHIKDLMRVPYIVPETKNIHVLLKELQSTRNYMAILKDEYGGFSGLVTLEDLIEELIGDICDEYDDNIDYIKKIDDDTYIVSGLLPITNINKHLNLNLSSESTDTIAGFLLENLGKVPKKEEYPEINIGNLNFKVLSLDNKRIDKIKISI